MNPIVRPMQPHEIDLMLDYFLGLDEAMLRGMGVEPSKLPQRDEWKQLLTDDFNKRIDQREFFYTTWELDGQPVGHSNVNQLKYGDSAVAHLHVWNPELRRANLGTTCFRKSVELFFDFLRLESLVCEPNAQNAGPNRTLAKTNFEFVETVETIPGWINFHQPVSRWRITRDKVVSTPRTRIETPRLILREFEIDDAPAVLEFGSHPEVSRFTGDAGEVESLDDALRVIVETWHGDYRTHGYGRLAVVDKASDRVIGFCGLKYLSDLQMTDIGYRFLPEFWGRGLATESATAVMDHGREALQLTEIVGMVMPENVGSRRVLEKLGLKESETMVEDGVTLSVYR